jgi:hypothetical protein
MHRFKMEVITAVASWVITSACQSLPLARNWLEGVSPRRIDDVAELGKKLSPSAKIYYPGSEGFDEASARWSVLDAPKVNVVVVPGTENDVSETVKFSSLLSFYFLYCRQRKVGRFNHRGV